MKTALILLTSLCFAALSSSSALATERHFAVSYETTLNEKGSVEYEQGFFWEHGKGSDTFTFRHEVEFGITDRFQLAFYLFDWSFDREAGLGKTQWKGSGIEAVYQLTDPNKSSFGSALYGEVLMNDQELELEGKILLQKNLGPLMVVYNGVIEAHWEDRYANQVGVLEQTLGLSYQLSPAFSVGLEAKHEVVFENWSHSGGNAVFVGPNFSFRKAGVFGAVAALFRASNVHGEPQVELSTVFGFHF
jgi:hypothetical protein